MAEKQPSNSPVNTTSPAASKPSPKAKPGSFSRSPLLTASEIESLKQRTKAGLEFGLKKNAEAKAKQKA